MIKNIFQQKLNFRRVSMKKKIVLLMCAFVLAFATGCDDAADYEVASPEAENVDVVEAEIPTAPCNASSPPIEREYVSAVFVESTDGLDDGVSRLIYSMEAHGYNFFRTEENPDGMIGANDVVLLQINAQWDQRGGTNTDLISSVIAEIVAHPEGFTGEIIVADNGQAQFGSTGQGGSLDWALTNSACRSLSTLDVINYWQGRGYYVTGSLWDEFTRVRVQPFSEGDYTDGFIVEDYIWHTGLEISFPKFTTEFGTHVSFREGIWDSTAQAYDSERLVVIGMPVLKSHMLFQQTGAVKGYMGVVSDFLTRAAIGGIAGRAHHSVGTGGMGTMMAHTRMPVLNIMDMVWIAPDHGPAAPFHTAVEINLIAASTDPVALDVWTTEHVLIPEARRVPGGRATQMNSQGTTPGTFGFWLRLSLNEMLEAGYNFTMYEHEMLIVDGR
jgi:hypothetical protein